MPDPRLSFLVFAGGLLFSAKPAHSAHPRHLFKDPAAVRKANESLVAGIKKQQHEPQWLHIVIHHTAVTKGSLKGIGNYHRKRFEDPLGIQYHFLVGNGHKAPDGMLEIARWKHRRRCVHVAYPARAPIAITISLMGNLHKSPPSQAQMYAVELLARRLMKLYRITPDRVSTNTRVDGNVTVCPGRHFPIDNLLWRLRHEKTAKWAVWKRPWPGVQLDGPHRDLMSIRRLLRPRYRCPRGKFLARQLETTAKVKGFGALQEARLLSIRTAHACESITRRVIGLKTAEGWFVQETNGYRPGRLRVRGKRGHKRIEMIDARGVMLRCRLDSDGHPVCETTTSGRAPKR